MTTSASGVAEAGKSKTTDSLKTGSPITGRATRSTVLPAAAGLLGVSWAGQMGIAPRPSRRANANAAQNAEVSQALRVARRAHRRGIDIWDTALTALNLLLWAETLQLQSEYGGVVDSRCELRLADLTCALKCRANMGHSKCGGQGTCATTAELR